MNADMTLVDVVTKDLSGGALDWAVGTVERLPLALTPPNYGDGVSLVYIVDADPLYRPSTNWSQGGPLIQKYRVSLIYAFEQYEALIGMTASEQNAEPLVAGCRAIVAANHGDIVKVPYCLVMP